MLGFTLISFTTSVHYLLKLKRFLKVFYEALVVIEEVLRIVYNVFVVDCKVLLYLRGVTEAL